MEKLFVVERHSLTSPDEVHFFLIKTQPDEKYQAYVVSYMSYCDKIRDIIRFGSMLRYHEFQQYFPDYKDITEEMYGF